MFKFILCLIFIPFIIFSKEINENYQYKLCIASIFQNEAPYLEEWLTYHHDKGVEHFWLYNNNSTDNYREILDKWIEKGVVDLIDWPSTNPDGTHFTYEVQCPAYTDAVNKARGISKWVALIDIDEFIVVQSHNSIIQLLDEFSYAGGLCVNWQCYGTSNIENVPEGEILKYLVWKMKWNAPFNHNSKSIVQPKYADQCINPHFFSYKDCKYAVDINHKRLEGCCNTVNIDKIRLNHYWTRDENFFRNFRLARYNRWNVNIQSSIELANSMNEEYDPILSNTHR